MILASKTRQSNHGMPVFAASTSSHELLTIQFVTATILNCFFVIIIALLSQERLSIGYCQGLLKYHKATILMLGPGVMGHSGPTIIGVIPAVNVMVFGAFRRR